MEPDFGKCGSDASSKASNVGTISYMPAAFGIACASVVIRDLAGL
jgi:tRNA A37 threonylcarbamoyladenosine dehydratase